MLHLSIFFIIEVECSAQQNSEDCFTIPHCGWCSDLTETGTGSCIPGGDHGPLQPSQCPAPRKWYFIEQPPCRCFGHSQCVNETVCEECEHNTEGKHCESCKHGYYGDPKNNGTCHACACNGHLLSCDAEGKCKCSLKGADGVHCESCKAPTNDEKYTGNATDGGMCYRLLKTGFQVS